MPRPRAPFWRRGDAGWAMALSVAGRLTLQTVACPECLLEHFLLEGIEEERGQTQHTRFFEPLPDPGQPPRIWSQTCGPSALLSGQFGIILERATPYEAIAFA